MSSEEGISPLAPSLPKHGDPPLHWAHLYGASKALALCEAARRHDGPVLATVPDPSAADRLQTEIEFFKGPEDDWPVLHFPDWETLPYDVFSPHQDIISERLECLRRLTMLERGIVVVPVTTLMVRIAPRDYLEGNSLVLDVGDSLDIDATRARLERNGYRYVSQVMEHGEFAVRGSLLDIFPMGANSPYRIDLLDDEVDSIRVFEPESQRSIERIDSVRMLPAREYPLNEEAATAFRKRWRARFEGDPTACGIYRDVSQMLSPPGIEYYLALFFEQTSTLFDYLPETTLTFEFEDLHEAAEGFWEHVSTRYEQARHDRERPLVQPTEVFVETGHVFAEFKRFRRIVLKRFADDETTKGAQRFATRVPTQLPVDARAAAPYAMFKRFIEDFSGRVLLVAETAGRRETLLETMRTHGLTPAQCGDWHTFLTSDSPFAITVAGIDQGALIENPAIALVCEAQLFGQRASQRRRRKSSNRDAESIIRDLSELSVGSPVVHEHHGVGRYRGLETLTVGDITSEFLTLEYADADKLYVPVSSLNLIGRYTGSEPDLAPLHKLGSSQWQKARRKAAERAFDVAAELLEVQARRAARPGHTFTVDEAELAAFTQGFPFEETPDQASAIDAVLRDMADGSAMDRLVCGDVGFGKTEVAMRAAFVAVNNTRQVALLVPTTLLAQQHHQSFLDRFADWPVRIEQLSRFRSKKERDAVLKDLATGKVDIVIGTHQLLQPGIKFKRLGLAIIDEEHRFGVRQKERLKALRAETDILTLTATPIPRTLNMALSGLRDLSLIATPPERRLSIKTFVRQWNNDVVREACLREIRRGGQVYVVHNRVEDIDKVAADIAALVPDANINVAHGQMPERELEKIMLDFYHRRFNILVCTTIIETGIDVPTANTILINRADRFGLAQLHQLRGRVGRSHHRAYAYLIVPDRRAMTSDAVKRLEAIESLEDLGIGFSLATHDLEIRGAGELLGEEQSGQIHEVGYSMYARMLERAVADLKAGRSPQLDRPLDHGTEIDLHLPALIPQDYLPDVHTRLIMYKRIASITSSQEAEELSEEMVDRFGPLPDAAKTLFRLATLKLKATPLGIRKLDFGARGGRIIFDEQPQIDPGKIVALIQSDPKTYKLDGPDKIKVSMPLEEERERVGAIEHLLDWLATRDAA